MVTWLVKALIAAIVRVSGLRCAGVPGATAQAAEHPEKVERILLWTMNSLGDVLRATPAIAAIRQTYPNAHIVMVAAGRAAPILRHNSNINELIEIPHAFRMREHFAALRQLKGRRWDLGVLLEVNPSWTHLEGLYMRRLGVPEWVCFELGDGVVRGGIGVPLGEEGSWIDQLNRLAAAAGARKTSRRMEIHLLDKERETMRQKLERAGVPRDANYILVHPGGNAHAVSRRWPAEHFAELVRRLRKRWHDPIVLTGTAPEKGIIAQIMATAGAGVFDLCGLLTMRELAAAIEGAALCVLNDTGPLHIAHALGRPTVAILGPTDSQVVGIPITTEIVRVDLPCSPCARFMGWRACRNPIHWECLHRVTPDMVFEAAERMLSPGVHLPVLPGGAGVR